MVCTVAMTLLNQTHAEHDVPYLCSLLDNNSVDGDVTESVMRTHKATEINVNDPKIKQAYLPSVKCTINNNKI